VDIVSALFVEDLAFRQVPGPATRIDLTGVQFSFAAPGPPPVTVAPHLVVLVRCGPDEPGTATLDVVFRTAGGEEVAHHRQPFMVEPGKFGYRLVKGDLTYDDYGTIEAHCSLDGGHATVVPLALLPPAP